MKMLMRARYERNLLPDIRDRAAGGGGRVLREVRGERRRPLPGGGGDHHDMHGLGNVCGACGQGMNLTNSKSNYPTMIFV